MFPQVLNAVVLSEGEESNLLGIICLRSFTIRLQKSLQESLLGLCGSLNSSLNHIFCPETEEADCRGRHERYFNFSEFKVEIASSELKKKNSEMYFKYSIWKFQ